MSEPITFEHSKAAPAATSNGDGVAAAVRTLLRRRTAMPRKRDRFELDVTGLRRRLRAARAVIATPASRVISACRGVDWLLDNYPLVLQVLRQLESDFDPGFAAQLPRLTDDPTRQPRVHALATLLVTSGDGFVDLQRAETAIRAAETDSSCFTLAELWALPVMLRDVAVSALVKAAESLPQAGGDAVRDAIQTLRTLDQADWSDFVERTSIVERVLSDEDPAGVHSRTLFETRNKCRSVVEDISRYSDLDQVEVARAAVAAVERGTTERTRHVGYVLIGKGRTAFERECGVTLPFVARVNRWVRRQPTAFYLGAITCLVALSLVSAVTALLLAQMTVGWVVMLTLAGVLPTIGWAVEITNWFVTRRVAPSVLPKMDFVDGIPAEARTVVVVPAMLTNLSEIDGLVAQLELHYLSGLDPMLSFALLTDFGDAAAETLPGDAVLIRRAAKGIEGLNARFGDGGRAPFLLFHRVRRFNEGMACWMSWERKRGKLEEFNRLLAGHTDPTWTIIGDRSQLEGVRFVITLDVDTRLPRDGARHLIETLAHPLNHAEFDASGRVVDGYTILQPRVQIAPWSADASEFARIFSGARGLDPYTHAVSDVYQDLFGEGIFVGKGVYDVVAFERATEHRVPEDAILSHDLFEGILGRAGLVSDVTVVEEFPATYIEFATRKHRWVRGDWQLLPWLGFRVPMSSGARGPSTFSAISRWKLADNLRRSLHPGALLVLFVLSWCALPAQFLPATFVIAAIPLFAMLPDLAAAGMRRATPRGVNSRESEPTLGTFQSSSGRGTFLVRWMLQLAFLPHEASNLTDAIVRTILRLAITKTQLLEWTTAAAMARRLRQGGAFAAYSRHLWQPPLVAALVTGILWAVNPIALPFAAPLLLLWFIAPGLAHQVSRPTVEGVPAVTPDEANQLRLIARQTWHFYDRFVGPGDHWLPPDHFQEQPLGECAHRTSPTNIGFYLLAVISAWRLGYISARVMTVRLRDTLETLAALPRYRGHLFNWYATDTLDVLTPRYVSSVDSGNLAGALIVVRQLCRSAARGEATGGDPWGGLLDAVAVVADAVARGARRTTTGAAGDVAAVEARVEILREAIARRRGDATHPEDAEPIAAEGAAAAHDRAIVAARAALHVSLVALAQTANMDPAGIADIREAELMFANQLRTVQKETVQKEATGRTQLREGVSAETVAQLEGIANRADTLISDMDFRFLYDAKRRLLSIGYDVGEHRSDPNHYDLLASEARLASLVAIAKGDVPREHWLHLGRPLGLLGRRLSLLSWSGTMFEYLMPQLVMRERPTTLLGQSCRAVVEEQIRYAQAQGVPWGISESGYYQFDAAKAYQYRAFGVPALGLKRGLSDDLVIAPYASVLALGLAPRAVCVNLERLESLGGRGQYGLYEAIDFTADRLPIGEKHAVVREYMAHHQGMILVAIVNRLLGDPFVDDFHSDPAIQTAEMLLDERPSGKERAQIVDEEPDPDTAVVSHSATENWTVAPDSSLPHVHLLSNGRLSSYLTAGGGGYLSWKDTRLTRWAADRTLEAPGVVILVGDHDTGLVWPLIPDIGDAVHFDAGSAEWRIATPIEARVRLSVSVDDDVETRQVRLRGSSDGARRLRIMMVTDISLISAPTDSHPAFAKLFVETQYKSDPGVVIARRRDSAGVVGPTVGWWAVASGSGARDAGFETSREAFVGRHGDRLAPQGAWSLRDTVDTDVESPLDAIAVVAVDLELAPHATAQLAFMTAAAPSEPELLALVSRYATQTRISSAVASTRKHAHDGLARNNESVTQLENAMRLLAAATLAPTTFRADPGVIERNRGGQSMLWRLAISGDVPIIVVCLGASEDAGLVSEVVRAQGSWRARGVRVDVVVLNQRGTSYDAAVDERVMRLVQLAGAASRLGGVGGVFMLNEDRMAPEDQDALLGAAQVVLRASDGPLALQLARLQKRDHRLPDLSPSRASDAPSITGPSPIAEGQIGDFSADGREYIIFLKPGQSTPAPWCNVIANDEGGCVVTEAGGGYTWSLNAGENRLTPWNNDPVVDPPGEVIYLRDEESCDVWTPTPQPAPSGAAYEVRHGAGYTNFRNESHGVIQELRVGMAPDESVKILRLRLTNVSGRPRRFTVTQYVEWVLGVDAEASRPRVVPTFDADSEVMLLRNPWNTVFGERVAFAAASRPLHGLTTDRTEFLGRRGTLSAPAALRRVGLSSEVGSDHDICSALQVHVDLATGDTEEVVFVIGQAATAADALELAKTYRDTERAGAGLSAAAERWDALLGRVQVRTPDPIVDRLVNRWLLYQSLSSRLMARTGFYQSSGAYGFRDQLQDVMALSIADPQRFRAHLLKAARHQFEEGDVLHWWHPPNDAGVRTRCSDDLVWLPFVVAQYIETTGDVGVLAEEVPYLSAPELRPEETDRYAVFSTGDRTEDLYRHCLDALNRADRLGAHGLPLIGSGDWNDGMDEVGRDGHGESVWLGWFISAALQRFAPICERRGDTRLAAELRARAARLVAAIEDHGWDGAWYRRGWFDDGTPLGSSVNTECRIDAISQSWSVISGAGNPERSRLALDAVREHLVRENDGLVLLLTPPFRSAAHNPGYIRAYPPGVRENGGQYTHAAIWTLWAIAQAGDPATAVRLFDQISPIAHGSDPDTYRVEPYVVAADIYSTAPHAGRGGWTWYTGAAAWSYRLMVEQILGIQLKAGKLVVEPNLPADWPGYEADVQVDGETWRVTVSDGNVDVRRTPSA